MVKPASWKLRQRFCSRPLHVSLGALLALLATPFTHAGPLPEHWVAKGSDWIIHVDAERLAQAEALTPLFDAMTASAWGASLTDMGVDARMDVSGITMFGTITRAPDARGETTTMLQGGAALREAIQKHVEAHNGYTLVLRSAIQAEGGRIDAWTIDALSVHIALVPMRSGGANTSQPAKLVAVLSDNSDRLQACIGLVLSEKTDNRPDPPPKDGNARLDIEGGPKCPPPGCVMFAWAKDLDDAHPKLRSELLASADSLVAHLGYREENDQTVVFASLDVRGTEEANGDKMVSALNGMIEFWASRASSLAGKNPAMLELLPLVEACQVSRDGAAVQLNMKHAIARPQEPVPDALDPGSELAVEPQSPSPGDR